MKINEQPQLRGSITPSPAGFTLLAGSATGQLITFAVAADAQLGSAQCTLGSSGPGRQAVTTATPIALNVIAPDAGASSSSSSTAPAGAPSSSSSSSTGGDVFASSSSSADGAPCVDAECGAFAAATLPGLATLVVMLLAAAFAQRQ